MLEASQLVKLVDQDLSHVVLTADRLGGLYDRLFLLLVHRLLLAFAHFSFTLI